MDIVGQVRTTVWANTIIVYNRNNYIDKYFEVNE